MRYYLSILSTDPAATAAVEEELAKRPRLTLTDKEAVPDGTMFTVDGPTLNRLRDFRGRLHEVSPVHLHILTVVDEAR